MKMVDHRADGNKVRVRAMSSMRRRCRRDPFDRRNDVVLDGCRAGAGHGTRASTCERRRVVARGGGALFVRRRIGHRGKPTVAHDIDEKKHACRRVRPSFIRRWKERVPRRVVGETAYVVSLDFFHSCATTRRCPSLGVPFLASPTTGAATTRRGLTSVGSLSRSVSGTRMDAALSRRRDRARRPPAASARSARRPAGTPPTSSTSRAASASARARARRDPRRPRRRRRWGCTAAAGPPRGTTDAPSGRAAAALGGARRVSTHRRVPGTRRHTRVRARASSAAAAPSASVIIVGRTPRGRLGARGRQKPPRQPRSRGKAPRRTGRDGGTRSGP